MDNIEDLKTTKIINGQGTVFAFKTDTVWGFGCLPEDEIAINKIYEIKKRDKKKPLILMSPKFEYLEKYVQNIPVYAYSLIEKYFPGKLTLIFEKSSLCSDLVTPFNTVGVRVPDSLDFSKLIEKLNTEQKVLATTSCNVSNESPVKDYFEAEEKFGSLVEVVEPINIEPVYFKECEECGNRASTVVLCKAEGFEILRQGEIVL